MVAGVTVPGYAAVRIDTSGFFAVVEIQLLLLSIGSCQKKWY